LQALKNTDGIKLMYLDTTQKYLTSMLNFKAERAGFKVNKEIVFVCILGGLKTIKSRVKS
jgi:hypothetical protein